MPLPGSAGRPAYQLYRLAWSALDWIYPPHCGGCGVPGARWCETCALSVPVIRDPLCPLCGMPKPLDGICWRCQEKRPVWQAARSWAAFGGPLQKAIHQLKYGGDVALGEALARPLIPLLQHVGWRLDVVVPVPIGLARREERGYNQAALLAKPLALGSGLAYQPKLLLKQRETRSQVGLSYQDRQQNVAGAFFARDDCAQGKRVLVVDDVMTSGATLEACALALLKAGAVEVFCLTLARAGA